VLEKSFLKIKVKDSGCGMNEEFLRNLFGLFKNLKFKESINQHGIGLGLTTCKKIVDSL
jgi:signal transduction histidine kinase